MTQPAVSSAEAIVALALTLDTADLGEVARRLASAVVRRLAADDAPPPEPDDDIQVSMCEGDPHAPPGPTPCALYHAGAYWVWQGGAQAKNDPQRYPSRGRAHDLLVAACKAQGVEPRGRFYVSPTPGVPVDDPAQGLPAGDAPQVDAIEEVRQAREGDPPPHTPILEAIEATDWLKRWRTDREYKAQRGGELVACILARWSMLHITDTSAAGKDAIGWLATATGKQKVFLRGYLWTMSKRVADKTHGGMPLLEDLARGAVLALAGGVMMSQETQGRWPTQRDKRAATFAMIKGMNGTEAHCRLWVVWVERGRGRWGDALDLVTAGAMVPPRHRPWRNPAPAWRQT